jgi:hypothetical protein
MGVADLIEGSLLDARERRKDLVARMAADLIRYEAIGTEADAVRSLFGRGYSTFDIGLLAGEARMLAFQEIVAREMSKS